MPNNFQQAGSAIRIEDEIAGQDDALARYADLGPREDFAEPSGTGKLNICRPSSGALSLFVLPEDSRFIEADAPGAVTDGRATTALQLQTTEPATFLEGRECALATARIITAEVPANYAGARPITGFLAAEGRSFRLDASNGTQQDPPDAAPLRARAITDFKQNAAR